MIVTNCSPHVRLCRLLIHSAHAIPEPRESGPESKQVFFCCAECSSQTTQNMCLLEPLSTGLLCVTEHEMACITQTRLWIWMSCKSLSDLSVDNHMSDAIEAPQSEMWPWSIQDYVAVERGWSFGYHCYSSAPNDTKRVQQGDAEARSSTQLRLPVGDQRLMCRHEERTVRQEELVTAILTAILRYCVFPRSSENL